jgi:tyrosyl-tRNA synthetase
VFVRLSLVPLNHLLTNTFSAAARQLAIGNGLYLNNISQPDVHFKLERSHLINGQVAILRAGKDKHLILALR